MTSGSGAKGSLKSTLEERENFALGGREGLDLRAWNLLRGDPGPFPCCPFAVE